MYTLKPRCVTAGPPCSSNTFVLPDPTRLVPDPLASAAPGILAHMNADHMDSMILLARTHAAVEATEATMTSVDRLGSTLRLKTNEGVKSVRINFLLEVSTSMETRTVLVEMVRLARQ
jgi:hypothetical protein